MRPMEAMTFAKRWDKAKRPEEKAAIFADNFEQIVGGKEKPTACIKDRASLYQYWAEVLRRRNGTLILHCVVFDCVKQRLAVVYARNENLLSADEADLVELDAEGRVVRSEVLDADQLSASDLAEDLPGRLGT